MFSATSVIDGMKDGLRLFDSSWRFRYHVALLGLGVVLWITLPASAYLGIGTVAASITWDYLIYRIRATRRIRQHGESARAFASADGFRRFYQTLNDTHPDVLHDVPPFGLRQIRDASPVDYLRRERLRRTIAALHLGIPRRHLDLGCKEGWVATVFRGAGIGLFGVDLSLSALIGFESSTNGRAIQADMNQLPFRAAAVDTVSLLEVIEHLENPLPVLAKIRHIMRPRGMLLLTTNNRSAVQIDHLFNPLIILERCLGLYFCRILPPAEVLWAHPRATHVFFHTEFARSELVTLLRRVGFSPTLFETYYFLGGLDRWLARIYPSLTESSYAHLASRLEMIIAHIPVMRWLGGHWLIVAESVSGESSNS